MIFSRTALLAAAATLSLVPFEGFDGRVEAHTPLMIQAVRIEIVQAAQALLASVPKTPGDVEQLYGISQRELALQPLDSKDRRDWSYWPRRRGGVALGQLSADQRRLVHQLLSAILSAQGHLQVVQTMQLEDVLHSLETTGFQRSPENYYITFFGEPSLDHPWALRFEGHHVSVNLTIARSSRFSATPLFLGAAPALIESGPLAGYRVLGGQEDLALRLVRSLSAAQAAAAVRAEAPGELLSSQFQVDPAKWDLWKREIRSEGVGWNALAPGQRDMAWRLIKEVVRTFRPEIADPYLKLIDRTQVHFLWLGATALGKPHYFRLTAGDFVYEFDNSQGNANHIHTVWRDRKNDLGERALEDHYRKSH